MGRRCVTILVAVTSTLLSLVAFSSPEPAAAAGTTDLLVGDSVMAGMSSSARSVLPNHIFDAAVCRRLVSTSCSYNGRRPSTALQVVAANAGRVNRAIVVAAGYNDGSIGSAVDAIVAEARRQGVPHVVWLTYRVAGTYAGQYVNHNATLWAKAAQYPELTIADWAGASAGRSDWVAHDGLHLTSSGAAAMANLISWTLLSFVPTRCDLAANGQPGVPLRSTSRLGPAAGIVMHATARRLVDTRSAANGAVVGGRVLRVPVPANIAKVASAVVVSVAAVDPCGPGFLTAYDCSPSMPRTSTLNPNRRGASANLAIVPLAADGTICVYTLATTDIVVDLLGHLAPGGQGMRTVAALRLVDTRPGMPDRLTVPDRAMPPRSEMTVRLGGVVGSDATAVALNLAVVGSTGDGYLTAYPGPCGSRPATSNLNYVAGETIAAATITALGPDRSICIYNHAGSHVIVDLTGVVEPSGQRLRTADNVRLVDTRNGGGARRTELRVSTDVAGAPADQAGSLVNAVAVGSRPGFVSVRPCGSASVPTTSTINHLDRPIANVAPVGLRGRAFCVYRQVPADLVVDAIAWLVRPPRPAA